MKTSLSFILAFAMLFGLLPFSVFASAYRIKGPSSVAIPGSGLAPAQEQYVLTESGFPVASASVKWEISAIGDDYLEWDFEDPEDFSVSFDYIKGVSIENGLLTVTDQTIEGVVFIRATYNGEKTSFCVDLVTATPVELSSIAVNTMPAKTEYFVGETPDYTGLTLTAAYTDASTETITSGFECSEVSTETAGVKTVTVTYEGKETTFDVTVVSDFAGKYGFDTTEISVCFILYDAPSAGSVYAAFYGEGGRIKGVKKMAAHDYACVPEETVMIKLFALKDDNTPFIPGFTIANVPNLDSVWTPIF